MRLIKRTKFVRFDFWVWILFVTQGVVLSLWFSMVRSFDVDGEKEPRSRCQYDLKKKIYWGCYGEIPD